MTETTTTWTVEYSWTYGGTTFRSATPVEGTSAEDALARYFRRLGEPGAIVFASAYREGADGAAHWMSGDPVP